MFDRELRLPFPFCSSVVAATVTVTHRAGELVGWNILGATREIGPCRTRTLCHSSLPPTSSVRTDIHRGTLVDPSSSLFWPGRGCAGLAGSSGARLGNYWIKRVVRNGMARHEMARLVWAEKEPSLEAWRNPNLESVRSVPFRRSFFLFFLLHGWF